MPVDLAVADVEVADLEVVDAGVEDLAVAGVIKQTVSAYDTELIPEKRRGD